MGLTVVELMMNIEQAFRIDIADAKPARPETVGQLYDELALRLDSTRPRDAAGPYSGLLWERYLDVVEETINIPRNRLTPDARFIQDLHTD